MFKLLTIDYNPLNDPSTITTIQSTSIIFFFIFIIFVCSGLAYIMIHQKFPRYGESLDYALNHDQGFDYKEYLRSLGTVISFLVFGMTGVWVLFVISSVLSQMMSITALDATVASPHSPIIYFFMGLAYLCLSIFISIRILVISIITKVILVLFALWAFDIIRDVITSVFIYFALMIFMQPILITIAALGILTIEWLLAVSIWSGAAFILYLGLFILLVVAALVLTLGPLTVMKLIRFGAKVAVL